MINYAMDLRAGPDGALAFRAREAEENPAWRQFYWSATTGALDLKRLRDDEVADWPRVHYQNDLLSRPVMGALAQAAESRVAVRIPSHASRPPEMAWLGWWISEAGLTVQLLTETEVLEWTPLFEERKPGHGDHADRS
jgi:hypothetical protein